MPLENDPPQILSCAIQGRNRRRRIVIAAAILLALVLLSLRPFFLSVACQQQSVIMTRLLLKMGTDRNTRTSGLPADCVDSLAGWHWFGAPWGGCPLLVVAAGNRQVAMIKLFLDYGANIDARTDAKCTAFDAAQDNQDRASMELLRARGASPISHYGEGQW